MRVRRSKCPPARIRTTWSGAESKKTLIQREFAPIVRETANCGRIIALSHMPATQEVSESLIRDNITRAISDVFKTMLGRPADLVNSVAPNAAESWPPFPAEGADPTPQVVGTVGFLGDANGLIYLYLPLPFAVQVTCHLLGMSESEIEESGEECINDAIGELTNMTVGSFKNGLCDAGFSCKLTIPSILRGSNFSVEPISSAQRYIYHYDCGGQRIVTDILLKTDTND